MQIRNRKHRRDAAKPAACAKPLMLSTLGRKELAATLQWFTAGGAIRIAYYDVIDDVITRKV